VDDESGALYRSASLRAIACSNASSFNRIDVNAPSDEVQIA
jgi:hypothetical protein